MSHYHSRPHWLTSFLVLFVLLAPAIIVVERTMSHRSVEWFHPRTACSQQAHSASPYTASLLPACGSTPEPPPTQHQRALPAVSAGEGTDRATTPVPKQQQVSPAPGKLPTN